MSASRRIAQWDQVDAPDHRDADPSGVAQQRHGARDTRAHQELRPLDPCKRVTAIDDRDRRIGIREERVDECHPCRLCTDDERVRFEIFVQHRVMMVLVLHGVTKLYPSASARCRRPREAFGPSAITMYPLASAVVARDRTRVSDGDHRDQLAERKPVFTTGERFYRADS